MNEISDVTGKLYDRYEKLILERDQIRKEAGSIWTSYLKEFGSLMTESFELKVECIRIKKEISYIMKVINTGKKVNVAEMTRQIREEMASYQRQLDDLLHDTKKSLQSKVSTEYTVRKVKQIYRQIARMIHPDIYPSASTDENIRNLWQRTQEAYHTNNLKELEELLVLAKKAVSGDTIQIIPFSLEELNKRIAELESEIQKIRTTDPYCYNRLLHNEEMIKSKKNELNHEIREYQDYRNSLEESLNHLLKENGIDFKEEKVLYA